MRNPLAIVLAIVAAGVCAQPLMTGLQSLVLPPGQHLSVLAATEPFAALALFALCLCACAGLAVAAACYLRHYSLAVRWVVVPLPMLAAGFVAALLKAAQLLCPWFQG